MKSHGKIQGIAAIKTRARYLIAVLVVAVFMAIIGWRAMDSYQRQQANNAAEHYATVSKTVSDSQNKHRDQTMSPAVLILKQQYPKTPYAARAALLLAKAYVDADRLDLAEKELQWTIGHAKEAFLRDAARLRLAAIKTDQKQFARALELLSKPEVDAYAGLFSDARGDILVNQKKNADAVQAYRLALTKTDKKAPHYPLIEMKLHAIEPFSSK